MSRFSTKSMTSLAMLCIAILGLAESTSAGDPRPFHGSGSGMVIGAEPVADGLQLTVAVTGKATHLGLFTRLETVVVHMDGSITGTMVFTAANGDWLHADVEGQFTSQTTVAGTYTFTGGTGRFENASGTADFDGVTPDGVQLSVSFDGTIDY